METKSLPYNSMRTESILRVALYIRVSTEEQALHGYSLQAQEEELVRYAEAQGFKIVKIYRDEGNSARKPALKRPVMQELLADVKAGLIDRILVLKLDRWFRNVEQYYSVQAILDKHNVAWQAILEDYQTATADGRLKVNIMLSVAENESDKTSERIKFVFKSKIDRGETVMNNRTAPMGYKTEMIDGVRKLVKDPETSEIVEEFFRLAIAYSIARAAQDVNRKYGLTRAYRQWHKMAKQELYTGVYRGVENYCEPYISRVDFEYINDRNKIIKKTPSNRIYLFTGMLRCPRCGRRLGSKYTNKPDKDYLYYRCPRSVTKNCDFTIVSESVIEKYLLDNVRAELEKFVLASEVKEAAPKTVKRKTDADKLNERLRRLNVAYFAGNIPDDEYTAQAEEIKAQIAKAKEEAGELGRSLDVEAIKSFLATDFETIYNALDREDRRSLWRSVVEEIYVEDKRVLGFKPRA